MNIQAKISAENRATIAGEAPALQLGGQLPAGRRRYKPAGRATRRTLSRSCGLLATGAGKDPTLEGGRPGTRKTRATHAAFAATAIALATTLLACVPALHAQGSRKDDIVFGPTGHPVSGATVRVCQATATGTPCTPLATLYTDTTLAVTAANPLQADGLGNYHFYAPAGRYQIQISSPQIAGTLTQADVILAPDVTSSSSPNNISAYGLTLGGNLSVAGNASIGGTLTSSGFNPSSITTSSLNVTGSSTVGGPRPYIDVTSPQYGAIGDAGAEQASGTISAGSNQLTIVPGVGTWQVGYGLHVAGAGPSGDTLLAKITAINGNVFTLSTSASTSVTGAGVQDDDTLAIQAAINAYCASPGNANGGSIYFPPGNYTFSQPQTSNPSASPFTACSGMHFVGGNSGSHNGTAFVRPPTASILSSCGSHPNAQPAFLSAYPANNVTFENLVIVGCNQAVGSNSQVLAFKNVALTVPYTGLTDNSALHLYNTFWVWFEGGALNGVSPNVPALLMTGDNCGGSCYDAVGDIYFSNVLMSGGPISYIQRQSITGAPAGHWVFRNITQESGNGDLIQITDPGAYTAGIVGPITLDDVQQADNTSPGAALINFNISAATLSGLYINNSQSGAGGAAAPAVKMTAGTLDHYFISGCSGACVSQVWNASGAPAGNGMTQSSGGLDFTDDVTNYERLITSPFSYYGNKDGTGPAARFIQSGSQFASFGIDAANGWMFGSNTQAGWNAQIFQSTPPNIDIAFAANYPPTNVSGTVSTTGGVFSTGTYYVWVVSNTNSSCSTAGGFSAPSNIYGPLTVGSGVTTAEFNLTWTAAAAGADAIQGYCVFVNNANQYNFASQSTNLISGAGTTSATVTTTSVAPGAYPITYQMVQEHHITPTGAIFNGISTPGAASGSSPYAPPCLAATACGAFFPLSPVGADSFTRASVSSLGANWAANFKTMAINGNTAVAASNVYAESSWVGQSFNADQWSRANIVAVDNVAGVGVMVRLAGAGVDTGYLYFCSTSSRGLYKRVAGTQTTLATSAGVCAVNDVIELDVVGTNLIALHNGVVDLAFSDSSLTSGAPGIAIDNTGTVTNDALVNWLGGSLPVGNATTSVFNQPNTWAAPQIDAPGAYASLPACGGAYQGAHATVKDSNTSTWGATIAGGGSSVVWAFCDGSNWTVAAK